MQGTSNFVKASKPQRIRNDQFDVKQDRRTTERDRQDKRAAARAAKEVA